MDTDVALWNISYIYIVCVYEYRDQSNSEEKTCRGQWLPPYTTVIIRIDGENVDGGPAFEKFGYS